MNSVRSQLSKIRISNTLNSGEITAVLTSRGIAIKFHEDICSLHTEETLEAEIELVLAELLTLYADAVQEIRAGFYGRELELRDGSMASVRRQQRESAVSEVEAHATSPRQYVSIDWRWRRDFMVVLRPGTLGKLKHHELTSEVNKALVDVTGKYNTKIQQISHDTNRIYSRNE